MARLAFTLLPLLLVLEAAIVNADVDALATCKTIASSISSASEVFYPLSVHYTEDISHWAWSSSEVAACSVEPGTAEDVSTILKILGSTQTPFAIKGGGHASNPGFSSTEGVQIAMTRFSEVTYDEASQSAVVGAGLVWDDVYSALAPHNVNVVGGRVSGVGVAGFSLGGGYSWLSNERGLTIDNTLAIELVLPNGTISTVSETSHPDLFFGLKGGFNNFGIVTKFTFKTFPQDQVWGGTILITGDQLDKVVAATSKFSAEVNDPKAAIITTFNALAGLPGVTLLIFYNGPTPPAGIFDDFLAIPHFTKDISTRSFLSLVKSSPSSISPGFRAAFHTLSVLGYSDNFLAAVVNETKFWGARLDFDSNTFVSYDIEPFLPSIFSFAPASSSAYPPSRARGLLPTNVYFAWNLDVFDDTVRNAIATSVNHLEQLAAAEGQDITDAPLYGNYALASTPLERIYGDNLPKLQALKAQYDPQNVMGLTGGWKF
ncbi:FAD-binding domain-containing protein [Abortiporus biennis]|nr:FAD-binding domain-containing protein [Abortiporus biennis]